MTIDLTKLLSLKLPSAGAAKVGEITDARASTVR